MIRIIVFDIHANIKSQLHCKVSHGLSRCDYLKHFKIIRNSSEIYFNVQE